MVDGLKVALYGLHRGSSVEPRTLARRAQLAEEVGFDSLWVGDHLALPFDAPDPADEPRLECVVALTYLAAVTERVELGSGVIVLPQRQPVLLAKQLASLDVLSGGRLTVGIGIGYLEAELRTLGVPLSERAARADEFLDAMLALWAENVPEFTGRFVTVKGVLQRPVPTQAPHPPIVVGGMSHAAHRRAVTRANGWYGWELDLEQTAQAIADLKLAENRYGRPAALGELEISITPPFAVDADLARRYAELGVGRLVLQPAVFDGTAIEQLIGETAAWLS